MQDHLDRELDVPTLARHAGYSERSFYRKFTEATGKTPAHFVEDLRLDAARTLLSKGLSLKTDRRPGGLKSSARLGQAFERRFGMPPSAVPRDARRRVSGYMLPTAAAAHSDQLLFMMALHLVDAPGCCARCRCRP